METLHTFFSSIPQGVILSRTLKFSPKGKTHTFSPICGSKCSLPHSQSKISSITKAFSNNPAHVAYPNFNLSLVYIGGTLSLGFPLSCFASEELPNRINLESVLVSIDNFFTKYPFFVYTVAFIWLIAIPLIEKSLQNYKFISALNAFQKLMDDPTAQLLDIREIKSLAYLPSPDLKILNKNAVQIEFREGDEDAFVKRVLEKFGDPMITIPCIIDNFDGNSMRVAELLVENGFKEAFAIKGGFLGAKGWTEIQEELLPPSVHVFPKKLRKKQEESSNGSVKKIQQNHNSNSTSQEAISSTRRKNDQMNQPMSPYHMYPDLKPPSSPTPMKPS